MSKVNMQNANRALVNRLEEYLNTNILSVIVQSRFTDAHAKVDATVRNYFALSKSESSFLFHPEEYVRLVAEAEEKHADIDKQFAAALAKVKEAGFVENEADGKLYAAYKSAETVSAMKKALLAWLTPYQTEKCKFEGTELVDRFANFAMNYIRANGGKSIVRQMANGKKVTTVTTKLSKGTFLKTWYSWAANLAIEKNCIKLMELPEDIREMYKKAAKEETATIKNAQ